MNVVRYFSPDSLRWQFGVWVDWRYYALTGFWFPMSWSLKLGVSVLLCPILFLLVGAYIKYIG